MSRPRTDKPLLTIRGTRGYFNAGAVSKCKINDNTSFSIVKVLKSKKKVYIQFNKKGKGYKCGKITSVRQSQTGMRKFLVEAKFPDAEGIFGIRKVKGKKRTFAIRMKNLRSKK